MKLKAEKLLLAEELSSVLLESGDTLQKMTEAIIRDLQQKREKLIIDRLKELGITLDYEVEQRRRFKSLAREYKGEEETIYYNDGSEQGLRVITFVTKQIPFDMEKMSMGYETHYY